MNQREWKTNLLKILNKCGIPNPKSYSIYQEALTHASYANEKSLKYNYERLEFLGDSAIQWVVGNYLYSRKPTMAEGEMSRLRSSIVKGTTLMRACKEIKLDELIFFGNSFKIENISNRIYEDIFEAFVGAIAQDQGIKKVSKLLNETIIKYYEKDLLDTNKDYKTQFQELIQASNQFQPIYKHKDGKVKISRLYCKDAAGNEFFFGEGRANNFKEADQIAAIKGLNKMVNSRVNKKSK